MRNWALIVVAGAAVTSHAKLVAYFPLTGSAVDVLNDTEGRLMGDAQFRSSNNGCYFSGKNGAVFFTDAPQYGFDYSFSIGAEVFVTALPVGGTSPQGQIVFRGDDRGGLDNYSLNLGNDGYYSFGFSDPENQYAGVRAKARLGQWERLLGVFDAKAHEVRLYINGFLASQTSSPWMPVSRMDGSCTPGFSIGNVQNPLGRWHNQPFHGSIRNVRLYNTAVMVDEAERPVRIDDR